MDNLSRTLMTLSCTDCDEIPKVADAGQILCGAGGDVQIMHNGVRVVAEGYHGDWMAQIIRGLRGHHEPQEELVFHHLLRYVRHKSVIVELGAFWAYYSLWFLREIPHSRALCVEPDPAHILIGRRNAVLNDMTDRISFVESWVGGSCDVTMTHKCESTGQFRTLPSLDLTRLLQLAAVPTIELIHIDVQGAETQFLSSITKDNVTGRVRFMVVSTHHAEISGSRTTHEDCLRILDAAGAHILIEHDIQASFSGDGLIVASFFDQDRKIVLPRISKNDTHNSLFPVP